VLLALLTSWAFCWAMAWSFGLFVSCLCLPCSLRLDAMVGFGLRRVLFLDIGLFSVCGIRSGFGAFSVDLDGSPVAFLNCVDSYF